MHRVVRSLLTGICTVGFSVGNAASIGVVDIQKIMQTAPQVKAIQEKLEKEYKPRRDVLVAQEETMKKEMEKFKRDNAVMSTAQKKELEKKIIHMQQDFEREGQKYQQELGTAHNEAMEKFYNTLRSVISKVADSNHYDIILQKDAAPYSATSLDITEKVIKEIH